MKNKRNKKGFTLAELLIVVAIIAVLVAIAIPVFTAQLEKSREATDLANLRAAYAEQMTAILTEDESATIPNIEVTAKQTKANWQSIKGSDGKDSATAKIGDGAGKGVEVASSITGWTVAVNSTRDNVTITAK